MPPEKLYFIYAEYRPVFQHTIASVNLILGTPSSVSDPDFLDELTQLVAKRYQWKYEYTMITSLSLLE